MEHSIRVRRVLAFVLAAALAATMAAIPAIGRSKGASGGDVSAAAESSEGVSVVEVHLRGKKDVDRLVATGIDLTHELESHGDGIEAQVVATPREIARLRAMGFDIGDVLWTEADWRSALAERAATIRDKKRAARAFGVDTSEYARPGGSALSFQETDEVKVIRADYYTSTNGEFLSVEAKTSGGEDVDLTVEWDSGPGTEIGSGGSASLFDFVDAGVYMYHRRAVSVDTRPRWIRVTSEEGGSDTRAAELWVPDSVDKHGPYLKDFVTQYMDPTDLDARIEQLAMEFPEVTELIELPNQTNGYRRKAAAILGSTSGGTNQSRAVVVESNAWGHEGGNDLSAELLDPGSADQALSVEVVGNLISVNLATDSTGAISSTAADVVAALDSDAASSALVNAFTYRGNDGDGVVQPLGPVALDDRLEAPDHISRDPWTVRALRICRICDGSKTGVFLYAQEHAREWVPPLTAIETAERLLRNYEHNRGLSRLIGELDIFILPSVNPDGGHYSFYDDGGQRRNMTNHCDENNSDPNRRDSWGVDINRNYDIGSRFDGYSGASSSCLSDVYSGPAELSEPESSNVVWLADTYDNIKFSMNTHSSGNYFMWSPAAYIVPGRIPLPRPTLLEENYFFQSSDEILQAIKRHRGLSVTPARTGPVIDVLYSAAGNSGDRMWYGNQFFAWNFEVGGAGFQPNWTEAHDQAMEFSNGMIGMLDVAYGWTKDNKAPKSTAMPAGGSYEGAVGVDFNTTEAAAIYYTTDGSRPTFDSPVLESAGVREDAETLVFDEDTTLNWFSVDIKGNIENGYDPDDPGDMTFNTEVYEVEGGELTLLSRLIR